MRVAVPKAGTMASGRHAAARVLRAQAPRKSAVPKPAKAGGIRRRHETPAKAARRLSRQVGDEAAQRALGMVQRKVVVGRANDPQEQEADRVAARVASGAAAAPAIQRLRRQEEEPQPLRRADKEEPAQPLRRQAEEEPVQTIRRQEEEAQPLRRADDEEKVETLRRQAEDEPAQAMRRQADEEPAQTLRRQREEEPTQALRRQEDEEATRSLRRKEAGPEGGPVSDPALAARISAPTEGRGLPEGVQKRMEPHLGADMSAVRVHDTAQDQADVRALGARAFAKGSHVWLGRGESASDSKLMAHELTHVAQQNGARSTSGPQRLPRQSATPEQPAGEPFTLRLPGGAVTIDLSQGETSFDLSRYSESIAGLSLKTLRLTMDGGKIKGGSISAGVSVPFVDGDVTVGVDEAGNLTEGSGKLKVVVPSFATGKLDWAYETGRLNGTLNVGNEQITVPGLPLKESSLTVTVAGEDLLVSGEAKTTDAIPGLSEGSLKVRYDNKRKAFAISIGAQVDVPGLQPSEFNLAMDEKGKWSGRGKVGADFAGASGSVDIEHENWRITKGEGTVAYERGPLAGSLTVRIVPPKKGKPGEMAISGDGTLGITIGPIEGSAQAVLFPDGNVDLSGAIEFKKTVELFKERKFEKTLFSFSQEFPLFGVTIPIVGSIGIIAEIHSKIGARTRFGPAVLRDVVVEGTYSTRGGKDKEAGGDAASGTGVPATAPEPSFAISGELFLPMGAELVIIIGGGVGLSVLIASVTGGIDLVGTAGAYATISVRPKFQYKEGKYSFKGMAELQAAAIAKLGVNAFAAAEVGIAWFSKEVWRKDWELAAFIWDPGLSIGLRAPLDYTLGEPFNPELTFEPVKIDANKLIKSAMPDSGQPTPDNPKRESPKMNVTMDPKPKKPPKAVAVEPPAGAGKVPAKAPSGRGKGQAKKGGTPAGPGPSGVRSQEKDKKKVVVLPKESFNVGTVSHVVEAKPSGRRPEIVVRSEVVGLKEFIARARRKQKEAQSDDLTTAINNLDEKRRQWEKTYPKDAKQDMSSTWSPLFKEIADCVELVYKELPPTKGEQVQSVIRWKPRDGKGRAQGVVADPLTKYATISGSPSSGIPLPGIKDRDSDFKWGKVRMHLLHGGKKRQSDLHGPGNQASNLTATSYSTNILAGKNVEADAIEAIYTRGRHLKYVAEVDYAKNPADPDFECVAQKVSITATDKRTAGKGKEFNKSWTQENYRDDDVNKWKEIKKKKQ